MNKKQLIIMPVLTLVLAFMEISGLPSALFVNLRLADVTPYIFALMANFVLIGLLAFAVMKIFGNDWKLGLHTSGLLKGLKKYSSAGTAAGILSCTALIIGLAPFDYKPSIWKIVFEGIVYYFGVAFVEELYVRGLLLNIVEKIFIKKDNRINIAVWLSSVVFGLGHIPGMIGMELPVIIFKTFSTIGMGLYFGVIYKKTDNLWLPVILHFFIDICALPYCFTTFSGYKTVSLYGLVIIYTLLGAYSIFLMYRKRHYPIENPETAD